MVDVQAIARGDGAHPLQLLSRNLACQQGDDMPGLALGTDPLLVIGLGHRCEAHLLVQLVSGEQHILEHRGRRLGIRDFHQNAERQGVMDDRLADVEDIHPALGQHTGNRGSQTGTVFTGDVNQDDFAQGRLPAEEKAHILTIFRGRRACPVLCPPPSARYTARQFPQ